MFDFFRKKYFWAILLIVILGIFLRAYHFRELLFFEVDQARDYRVVQVAIKDGVGELPLLGPGMSQADFRVGPIFHYIQYVFALAFGGSPQALAYPDFALSIISIIVFYFLLKEFFSKYISAWLVLLYASSLFMVEYSRFAWNTNSIPFFSILIAFSLLKISKKENAAAKWPWICLLAISSGIGIQLHGLTLVAFPIIILAYIFITRTKLNWKQWAVSFFIILLITSPMILNEIMTNFESIRSLFAKSDSAQKPAEESFPGKKLAISFQELSKNYYLILASGEDVRKLDQTMRKEGFLKMLDRNIVNNKERTNFFISLAIFGFFAWSFCLLFRRYRRFDSEESGLKNFIALIFIYQAVFLILLLGFIGTQHTRYYLLVAFVPFVLLGVYLEKLERIKKYGKFMIAFSIIFLASISLARTAEWLAMIKGYAVASAMDKTTKEYILDPYFIVTLNQMERINDYVKNIYAENKKEVRIISPNQFYSRSIRYLLVFEKQIPARKFDDLSWDKQKMYYLIKPASKSKNNGCDQFTEYEENFKVIGCKNFGTLSIYSLQIKNSVSEIAEPHYDLYDRDEPENDRLTTKYTWNDFFEYVKNGGRIKNN